MGKMECFWNESLMNVTVNMNDGKSDLTSSVLLVDTVFIFKGAIKISIS